MKAFKIIFSMIIVLGILTVVGLLIFIKTVDLNRFKTQIQEGVGKSIDREVSLKSFSVNFSFSRGIFLDIRGLAVKDHPAFSSAELLSIDAAHINIDVLPFLLSRKIYIQKVELHSPEVNIIRDSDGALNIPQWGQAQPASTTQQNRGTATPPQTDSAPSKPKAEISMSVGELLIRSIRITDGTLNFTDRSVSPENIIPVTQLDVQVSNLSLNEPFPVQANASLWGTRKNVHVSGLVQLNQANEQVRIDDLKISTDISELELSMLFQSFPSVKRLNVKDEIEGKLALEISQMVMGREGLLMLAAEGRMDGGKLTFRDFPVPIEDIQARFTCTDSDFEINTIELPLASGTVAIEGRVIEYLSEQKFTAQLNINDIQLSEISDHVEMPAKVAGSFNGQFTGKGEGFEAKQIESNLTGDGKIVLKAGKILGVNILKTVLSRLSFIPNVVEKIEQNLPDQYKEKLKQKDTDLGDVAVDARIRAGALQIDRAELNADGFMVKVGGQMDFLQNVEVQADLYIVADLSGSMVQAVPELSYFLDDRRQIHIPFKPYSGPLIEFSMYPDVGDISKTIIQNRGREELRKVLEKALDIEEEPPAQPAPASEPPVQEQKEMSPEEAVIEKILDILPVFQ
ncbi:MAG: hypothetical protein A3C36_06695 [Omnitrophica WOR_2 bacterium RIFCSPHIGHO2_02_FULL_52_10]|nr:MAG: hypothetical protein A3C36_06695 [Omnitrophica WOR_2 bacterium RIFCSPHIGHO2_02_FULL_52_10]